MGDMEEPFCRRRPLLGVFDVGDQPADGGRRRRRRRRRRRQRLAVGADEVEAGLAQQLLEAFQLRLQRQIVGLELVQSVLVVGVLVLEDRGPPLQRVHVLFLLAPTLLR